MAFITRQENGAPLSWSQMDGNLITLNDQIKALTDALSSANATIADLSRRLGETTAVEVSSVEILNLGSRPVVLLPSPGDNNYYAIKSVRVEYFDKGTPYTVGTASNPYIFITTNSTSNMFLQKAFITTSGDKAFHFTHFEGGLDTTNVLNYQYNGTSINKAIELKTWGNVNPTLGNGILRFVFNYTIEKLGA